MGLDARFRMDWVKKALQRNLDECEYHSIPYNILPLAERHKLQGLELDGVEIRDPSMTQAGLDRPAEGIPSWNG